MQFQLELIIINFTLKQSSPKYSQNLEISGMLPIRLMKTFVSAMIESQFTMKTFFIGSKSRTTTRLGVKFMDFVKL